MLSNHLILCCPFLLLLSVFPSIRVFSNESTLHIKWPKYKSFSFSFSIHPSNEYSRLVSFKNHWFDLFAVQGTLKSLFSTTVWKHQFLGTQLSSWSKSHICIWLLEKPWLRQYRPLLSRWCLFFSICCLGSSSLLFQGQVSQFCGCSHRPQWFWSPRKWNLSLFPFFPIYLLSSDGTSYHDLSFLNIEF